MGQENRFNLIPNILLSLVNTAWLSIDLKSCTKACNILLKSRWNKSWKACSLSDTKSCCWGGGQQSHRHLVAKNSCEHLSTIEKEHHVKPSQSNGMIWQWEMKHFFLRKCYHYAIRCTLLFVRHNQTIKLLRKLYWTKS